MDLSSSSWWLLYQPSKSYQQERGQYHRPRSLRLPAAVEPLAVRVQPPIARHKASPRHYRTRDPARDSNEHQRSVGALGVAAAPSATDRPSATSTFRVLERSRRCEDWSSSRQSVCSTQPRRGCRSSRGRPTTADRLPAAVDAASSTRREETRGDEQSSVDRCQISMQQGRESNAEGAIESR